VFLAGAVGLAGLLATQAPAPVSLALIPAMDCGSRACEDSTRLSMLQSALTSAIERRQMRALADEELFVNAGADFSRRIRSCGPELSCICAASSSLPADLLLVLLASVDRDPVLLGVRLIDRNICKIVGQAVKEAKADAELGPVVTALAAGVLEKSGYPRLARVKFQLEPADAIVAAPDSMSMDYADAKSFTGKPGKHTVVVSANGYIPQTIEVELDGEKEMRVSLDAEASIIESPWLWIIVGVAAAGAVTGGILWMNRPEVVCVVGSNGTCDP
jgi:hypothetical protein